MVLFTNLKKRFSTQQLLILGLISLMVFPYYIFVPVFLISLVLFILFKKINFQSINWHIPKPILIFLGITFLVSLFNQNYLGLISVIAALLISLIFLNMKEHIDKSTFEFALDLIIAMSLFWGLVGIYEEIGILNRLGVDGFTLHIFAKRENRINSVFANANYYAMTLEFLIPIIVYKFFNNPSLKIRIYYLFVAFYNLVLLYYTGCRAGVIALLFGLLAFFLINKNYKLLIGGLSCLAVGAVVLFLKPSLVPRINFLGRNIGMRMDIWKTAIKGIKANPLFGQGPFSYLLSWQKYHGYNTHHGHSIYLDFLMNYGFAGLLIMLPTVYFALNKVFYQAKNNRSYFALIISLIVIVLIHGLVDVTILWIHSIIIFVFIIISYKATSHS